MKARTWRWAFGSLVFLIGTSLYAPASDVDVVKEFRARADQYAKLHRSVESKLPAIPTKATPEQINAHQHALAAAIREARANANRGDIFGMAEEYFRRMVADAMKGKEGAPARKTIQDGNPVNEPSGEPIILAANAPYPSKAPLSSVPPLLLLRLSPLPDELNYRFVGRHLILHDTHADMIVDFVLNVVP